MLSIVDMSTGPMIDVGEVSVFESRHQLISPVDARAVSVIEGGTISVIKVGAATEFKCSNLGWHSVEVRGRAVTALLHLKRSLGYRERGGFGARE